MRGTSVSVWRGAEIQREQAQGIRQSGYSVRMTEDPLQARAGDGAVFQQLLQRAFDEDMRQIRLPADTRRTDPDLVVWCGSGKSSTVVLLLQAKWHAEAELDGIRGALDRLNAMAASEAVGASVSPAQSSSSAKAASWFGRHFSLAAHAHALREQAAALEALLALLQCALEQLLGGTRVSVSGADGAHGGLTVRGDRADDTAGTAGAGSCPASVPDRTHRGRCGRVTLQRQGAAR